MMIGKTILHYKILDILGKGGMGIVYKAEDRKLGRTVALKFLSDYSLSDEEDRARFEREARAAASLNHPNICTIFEFHQTDEYAFIAMEYIEGETVKQILKRDGPFPQEKAAQIIIAIAEALAEAHNKGVIHRDIKSDNIMITKDGAVKVMDFGLAKLKDAPTITRSKSPMGTVGYMSPELIQEKKIDHRTDLWSLGVVFFEMLTGELPFRGDTDVGIMRAIINDEPDLLSNYNNPTTHILNYIILKLLEKDVQQRYSTTDELIKEIQYGISNVKTRILLRKIQKKKKQLFYAAALLLLVSIISFQIYREYNKPFWLKKNKKLTRLTQESGDVKGRISPDGSKIVYRSGLLNFRVKNLSTGEDFKIFESDTYNVAFGTAILPTWSPDGNFIAYVSDKMNSVSKVDWKTKRITKLTSPQKGNIFYLDWSPDGNWISYLQQQISMSEFTLVIKIVKSDGSELRQLNLSNERSKMPYQMAWHPDSKGLAYYEISRYPASKTIRYYDIETDQISDSLYSFNYPKATWSEGGLVFSPDGKFLIFPEKVDNAIELCGLPVKIKKPLILGNLIQITNLAGVGTPFYPEFNATGDKLSFVLEEYSIDIYRASLNLAESKIATKITPITKSKKLINFACWSPDGEKIACIMSSLDQNAIYLKDLSRDDGMILFDGMERKIRLQFLPEGNALSYMTLAWDLWELPLAETSPRIIYPRFPGSTNLNIYSYCWGTTSDHIYAIVSSKDSTNWGEIVKLDLNNQEIEFVLRKIKSPIVGENELRLSPDGHKLAFRCSSEENDKYIDVRIIDIINRTEYLIMRTPTIIPFGEISWTPGGQFLLFGAYTEKHEFNIYYYSLKENVIKVFSTRPLTEMYCPGQVSPNGDETIFSIEKMDSDIWMLSEK